MEGGHVDTGHSNPLVATILAGCSILCFWGSHVDPSELRAWVAFTLGAIASITSIILNVIKWRESRKYKRKK